MELSKADFRTLSSNETYSPPLPSCKSVAVPSHWAHWNSCEPALYTDSNHWEDALPAPSHSFPLSPPFPLFLCFFLKVLKPNPCNTIILQIDMFWQNSTCKLQKSFAGGGWPTQGQLRPRIYLTTGGNLSGEETSEANKVKDLWAYVLWLGPASWQLAVHKKSRVLEFWTAVTCSTQQNQKVGKNSPHLAKKSAILMNKTDEILYIVYKYWWRSDPKKKIDKEIVVRIQIRSYS